MLYEGDLDTMCPTGYGILCKGEHPIFEGDFTQPLTLATLNGTTYRPRWQQGWPDCPQFFGIKYELNDKDGKPITDAYYFGDVVSGKPKGKGGVYRYSVQGGDSATYAYVGATDLVDVKFE